MRCGYRLCNENEEQSVDGLLRQLGIHTTQRELNWIATVQVKQDTKENWKQAVDGANYQFQAEAEDDIEYQKQNEIQGDLISEY